MCVCVSLTACFACTQDYHVILIHQTVVAGCKVYDFDTDLPFPCDFSTYVHEAVRDDEYINPMYQRYDFKIIVTKFFACNCVILFDLRECSV